MWVYIWTDKLKYDFKNQNVLTFKYQWDNTFTYGYTAWSWYYTLKTWSSQWVTVWALPNEAYVNDVKKITIKYSIDNGVCGFSFRSNNGQTWIRSWRWSSDTRIQSTGTNYLSEVITAPSGNVEAVLDLKNWTISYWTYTFTLPSDFASSFKTEWANGTMYIWISNWNYNVWSNNYYTYMKEITIED